jgi:hypothetical protein
MAIEDRLEELFMSDANNRRVSSVNIPPRPSPLRGVIGFAGVAILAGVLAVVVISALRGGPQAAAPGATPTATAFPTTSPAATASVAPSATTAPATAGTVTGKLGYPSDFIPALAIYALPVSNLSDGRYVIFTERTTGAPGGSVTYTMQVPAGTYYFVAYVRDTPVGSRNGAGAYTRYVTCGMTPACDANHDFIPVTVTAGQTNTDIDIRDWYRGPDGYPPRPAS